MFSPRQKTTGITRLRSQDAEDLDTVLEVVAHIQQAVTWQVNIRWTDNPLRKVKDSMHHAVSREDLQVMKTFWQINVFLMSQNTAAELNQKPRFY